MGNMFGRYCRDIDPDDVFDAVDLNNKLTEPFLGLLQLALSDLAESEWERALAQWFAWHDQKTGGRGCIGFDLTDIAWTPAELDRQKAFLNRAIEAAAGGYRWDETAYFREPLETYIVPALQEYRALVEGFALPDQPYTSVDPYGWPTPEECGTRCQTHRVHCNLAGNCRICADF